MTATELQEVFRQLPAGPFTVQVAERAPVEVPHSDFAMRSLDGQLLSVWAVDGHMHHIAVSAITRITHSVPAGQTAS